MNASAASQAKFDIHVFVPKLQMTLFSVTYRGFASAAAAKEHFLRVHGDEHAPEHVSVSQA